MKIDANSQALSKILTMESREYYHIPPYQRPYSWKEEQIDQLFQDIEDEPSGYYIGNILVTKHDVDDDASSTVYEVIDGQQRLTTLSLFLLAIWQIVRERTLPLNEDDKELSDQMNSDIGRRLMVNRNPSAPRLQLLADDAGIYQELIRAVREKEQPQVKKNRKFYKRYRYIVETLADTSVIADMAALYEFYDKLINVLVLQIEAASIGDAFSIFSSLNSKGLPLTLVDLLKSEFLGMDGGQNAEGESVLEQQWETLIGIFAKDGNAGDASDVDTTALTQFFLNNYDAFESTKKGSVTKSKALTLYQEVIKKKRQLTRAGRPNVYLKELIRRARAYVNIIQLSYHAQDGSLFEDADIRKQLANLKQLESTQAYPLLLLLFVKAEELQMDATRMSIILRALVTFYVRRNITEVPKSSNIRAKIIGIIRAISADSLHGDDIVRLVVQTLKSESRDEDFGSAILQRPIYEQNSKTTRFVLIDLEQALQRENHVSLSTKAHPLNLNDVLANGKPRWTIEHILPEGKLPDHWQQMIAPDHPEDAEDLKEEYTHRIGNLTLTAYNENMQQKPFAEPEHPVAAEDTHYNRSKRDYKDNGEYVGMRSRLQINTSIPQVGERIEDKTSWTIDDITRRSEWFCDEMLKRYRFPDID
ncbi:MAG: DUF262 domain-containing protein [Bifidobacterium pseudolongum]|jgi:uncharacterized protein with ParB-like and HNH nuclease domain|nr:DUF262 domain-containing protein [Bifidobacterium pseudolongum]